MFLAIFAATRHSCLKRGAGAVIRKGNKAKGTGYCGATTGLDSCLDKGYCFYDNLADLEVKENGGDFEVVREGFKTYCLAVHAEDNATTQCTPEELKGATLYITNFPCPRCAQNVIINKGIKYVVVWKAYLENSLLTIDEKRASERKFLEAGVAVKFLKLTPERIKEIAEYMAMHVGERTSYKYNVVKGLS